MQISSYMHFSSGKRKIRQEREENVTGEAGAEANLCLWLQDVHEALVPWWNLVTSL